MGNGGSCNRPGGGGGTCVGGGTPKRFGLGYTETTLSDSGRFSYISLTPLPGPK